MRSTFRDKVQQAPEMIASDGRGFVKATWSDQSGLENI